MVFASAINRNDIVEKILEETLSIKKYHLHEQIIPDGYQIFESALEVMGVQYRKEAAIAFAKKMEGSWLEFEKDDDNEHDKNAIKLIGCNSAERYLLGYAPRETSRLIIEGGFWGQVSPRLYKTYVDDDGYVEIFFQVIGPAGKKYEYLQTEKTQGEHYSDYVNRVKQLMQDGKNEEAIELLLRLVDWTEREAKKARKGQGVAPIGAKIRGMGREIGFRHKTGGPRSAWPRRVVASGNGAYHRDNAGAKVRPQKSGQLKADQRSNRGCRSRAVLADAKD